MRKHAILRSIHKPDPVHPAFSLKTRSRTHRKSRRFLLKTRSRTRQKNCRNLRGRLTAFSPDRPQTMKQCPRRIRPLLIPMKMRRHPHHHLRQDLHLIHIPDGSSFSPTPPAFTAARNPLRLFGQELRILLYPLQAIPLTCCPGRFTPAARTKAVFLIRPINRRAKPSSTVRADIPAGAQPFFSSATFLHLPYNFQPMTQGTRQQQEARIRIRKIYLSCMNKRQFPIATSRQFHSAADMFLSAELGSGIC